MATDALSAPRQTAQALEAAADAGRGAPADRPRAISRARSEEPIEHHGIEGVDEFVEDVVHKNGADIVRNRYRVGKLLGKVRAARARPCAAHRITFQLMRCACLPARAPLRSAGRLRQVLPLHAHHDQRAVRRQGRGQVVPEEGAGEAKGANCCTTEPTQR